MQWDRLSVGEGVQLLAKILPELMTGIQNTAFCQTKETVSERTQILVLCMFDFHLPLPPQVTRPYQRHSAHVPCNLNLAKCSSCGSEARTKLECDVTRGMAER